MGNNNLLPNGEAYLKELKERLNIVEYFNILSQGKGIPRFLLKYLEVPEIYRLKYIGYFCGMDYCSKHMFDFKEYYSRLDHSLAVALITWHFTKGSIEQTIAAFLHDITTPVTSHTIDKKNGDALIQEHTEKSIRKVIENSPKLQKCLEIDGLKISDVENPKKYHLVDNNRPKLCADRIDGVFSTSRLWGEHTDLIEIKEIYDQMVVLNRPHFHPEIGFESIEPGRKVFDLSIKEGYLSQTPEDKLCLGLLGDIIDEVKNKGLLTEESLYAQTEPDLFELIKQQKNNEIEKLWHIFTNVKEVEQSDFPPSNTDYCIKNDPCKIKYINPLIYDGEYKRITEIDANCKKEKTELKNISQKRYIYASIVSK